VRFPMITASELKPVIFNKRRKKFTEEKTAIEKEKKVLEEEKKKLQKEREKLLEQLELERQTMLKEIEAQKKDVKKEPPKEKKEEDPFLNQLVEYFKDKKIELVGSKVIKKKTEVDLILKVPSVVGDIEYYCKARNKKSVSDADLSAAVVQGQLKKLPVLFLTTGELTKKAKELLNTELNKGLLIKKI